MFICLYPEKSDGIIFKANIYLDSRYQATERTVLTLGSMFGGIGGIDFMIYITAIFFVKIFSSKIYIISLISSFYSTIEEQSTTENQALNEFIEEEKKESFINLKQDDVPNERETQFVIENIKKQKTFDESSFSNLSNAPVQWNLDKDKDF